MRWLLEGCIQGRGKEGVEGHPRDPQMGCHRTKPRGAGNREAGWSPGYRCRDLWVVTVQCTLPQPAHQKGFFPEPDAEGEAGLAGREGCPSVCEPCELLSCCVLSAAWPLPRCSPSLGLTQHCCQTGLVPSLPNVCVPHPAVGSCKL